MIESLKFKILPVLH